jgi:rhodanese-related sulfurtransferase
MPTEINRDAVKQLVASGAQLIEVLPVDEYNQAHIPGALNIPLKTLNRQSVRQLDPDRPVITYCHDFQ